MKASIILTLPVLALAAATPAKVEKRQFNPLPCLQEIEGLSDCIDPAVLATNPFALFGVVLCLPPAVLRAAGSCLRLPGFPGLPLKE